ncbi:MAG: hypothetical protein V2A61_07740 [Calditrichota bacterium]
MLSGHQAGLTAAEALAHGDVSARFLSSYLKKIKSEIISAHQRAYRLKQAVYKLSDADLNRAASELNLIPPQDRNLAAVFLKVLARHPRLIADIMLNFMRS